MNQIFSCTDYPVMVPVKTVISCAIATYAFNLLTGSFSLEVHGYMRHVLEGIYLLNCLSYLIT